MQTAPRPILPERPIASGATGTVWLAGEITEPVALKRPRPELRTDPRVLAAFQAETEALRAVRSAHVVQLIGAGEDEEGPWIATHFLPGASLRGLQSAGPLAPEHWRGLAIGLSEGLAALHAAGFLHGDLKPENARLDTGGEAVWLDLGFARRIVPTPPAERARPGSLAYLAPEQARNRAAQPSSEVFSLGVVLRELATGEHPFATALRGGSSELLAALSRARLNAASELSPTIPPFVDALLEEALAADPARRPSAGELAERLREGTQSAWWRALTEASRARAPVPGHAGTNELPWVGRERELAEARALWSRVIGDDRGAVLWLTGEIGSGKSRLVRELVRRLRRSADPPLFLSAKGKVEAGVRGPAPLLSGLARVLRLPVGSAPGEEQRAGLLERVSPRDASTLLEALRPGGGHGGGTDVPGALARWFAGLGRSERVVLFLDDLGRANEGTLDVVARIAERLAGTRTLLILGLREEITRRNPRALDELRQRVSGAPEELRIELEALDAEAVHDLVAARFDPETPRLELARLLHERSLGNAGLIAETLRGLVGHGQVIELGDGRLHLCVEPAEILWPRTLSEAISSSYRALPAGDRRWLGRLAVAGRAARPELLRRAFTDAAPGELEEALSQFVASGWIEARNERYRFVRRAFGETLNREFSSAARRRAHEALATALTPERGAPIALEDAHALAHHLREAGRTEELLRWIPRLLPRWQAQGGTRHVRSLTAWGLEALEKLEPTPEREALRIDLLEAATDASDRLGHREAQRKYLDHLAELPLDPELEPRRAGRVYLLHGRYALSVGRYGVAHSMLRHAFECLARVRDRAQASEAARHHADLHAQLGEAEPARRLARRALEMARDDRGRALAEIALGVAELLDDAPERALRRAATAVRAAARVAGPDVGAVHAQANLLRARAYRAAGRPRRALASAQRALRQARAAGERRLEAEASGRVGGHLLDLDFVGEAEERGREALRLAIEIEDARGEALAGLLLGILLAEEDRAEAEARIGTAIEQTRATGLRRLEAVALAIEGRLLRQAGELARALESSSQAMTALEQHGAELMDRAVIVGSHAVLLRELGRGEESLTLLDELQRRFRRANQRIESQVMRRRQRLAATRLLDAVLSPDGPIFPRVRIEQGEERVGPPKPKAT